MNKTMNERFDERFNRMIHFHRGEVLIQDTAGHFPICKDEDGNFTTNQFDAIKYFIQSEIDLAVAEERKRIVEIIENELEISCVDDRLLGKTDEYLQGYNKSSDRWREKRDNIINLITNK